MKSWCLSLVALLAASDARAWGHRGHQTLATLGSQIVSTQNLFWTANATNMGMLSNVPDRYWKVRATAAKEKPTHYFQPDAFFSTPDQFFRFPRAYPDAVKEFTRETIEENGTAPWRIKQFYNLAVAAFAKKDLVLGLQMAGAMSHYVGDLSQPLHVTKNYDGQETGNKGVHKYFETDLLEQTQAESLSSEVKARAQALLKDPAFLAQFNGSVEDVIFAEIDRAYAFKDPLIDIDLSQGRGPKGSAALLEMAKDRLADGAATLALLLNRISQDSNVDAEGASVTVPVPKWVEPKYDLLAASDGASSTVSDVELFRASLVEEDDCAH